MIGPRTHHVLNLGAGVQSTALYLMFLDHLRDLEARSLRGSFHGSRHPEIGGPLDYAVFADTQDEPSDVYRHLAWLETLDGPPILYGTAGRLGDDLISGMNARGLRFASIPAFTSAVPGGACGMLRRQCTSEYKVRVVERVIRREILDVLYRARVPEGARVVQYFGLSHDEPRRVAKVRARFHDHPWSEARFPLFDLEMTRGDCVAFLREWGVPHEVPRSACVFCRYKTNDEWRLLRDKDPEGWARAVEVDEALREPGTIANRGMDQAIYLHRGCLPLAETDLGTTGGGPGVSGGECEGMCGL